MIRSKEKHYVSGLSRKLFIYSSIAILIFLVLSVGLIYQVGNIAGQSLEMDKNTPGLNETREILKGLQIQIIIATSVILLGIIVAMIFIIRNMAKPLDDIGRVACRMADGRLDELIRVKTLGEIGKIGEFINDIAMNLQEIMLHVWNHTKHDILILDRIVGIIKSQPDGNGLFQEISEDFRIVKEDIENMRSMVEDFDYYGVRLKDGRTIADHDNLKGKPAQSRR